MKEEIKEILDNLRFSYEQNKELYEKYNQDVMRYIIHLKEAKLLLDYITNLQEKYERMKENADILSNGYNELEKRNEKAIEYIKDVSRETLNNGRVFYNELPAQDLLNILKGEDKQ